MAAMGLRYSNYHTVQVFSTGGQMGGIGLYAQPLSNDFAFQMRRLMQTQWYRQVFPGTHIDPKKSGVEEIRTTRGG